MYDNPTLPMASGLAAGSTGFALTGANVFWIVLAAFALLALGMAVGRILPRRRTALNAEDHLSRETTGEGRP